MLGLRRHIRIVVVAIVVATLWGADRARAQPAATAPIRVVIDDNYPPFSFRDEQGKLQGVLIDEWRLWERQTGRSVDLRAMDWAEALRRMAAGEFDAIGTIFRTPAREKIYDFSRPMARLKVPIFFRRELSGITGLTSLRGFAVAAKEGDAAVDLLRANGVTDIHLFTSYEAIITAAKEGKVNVFVVDEPPAHYFLTKFGIEGDFRESAPVSVGEFHYAVKKGNQALLNLIQTGFDAIPASARRQINDNWFGKTVLSPRGRRLGFVIVGGSLLLLLLLGSWAWLLRREVRRQTAALVERAEQLRSLGDNLPNGMVYQVVRSADGRQKFLYVSSGVERLHGVTAAMVLEDAEILRRQLAPEDRARVVAAEEASHRDFTVFNLDVRIRSLDGVERWLAVSSAPRRLRDGRIVWDGIELDITARKKDEHERQNLLKTLADSRRALLGILEDQRAVETALREREARLRALFEAAPVGIAEGAVDSFDFLYINQRYCEIVGYPHEELAKMNFRQLAHPDDSEVGLPQLARLRAGEIRSYTVEKRFIRKDGGIVRVSLTVVALWEVGAKPDFHMAVVEDITARHRAEEELLASHAQLRALAARLQTIREEQSTHIAREIHDVLGQQLTALKLDLAWLKRRAVALADAAMGAVMTEKLVATSRLVDTTIQTVQKIATELRPGLLDRLGLVAAIEGEVRDFAGRSGVQCLCDLTAEPLVLGDAVATGIFRVFQEMLTNVARHAHATEVRVRLAFDGANLVLEVRDNGRGLAPGEGVGPKSLGLLGMSERALLLGGTLQLRGGPGGGTLVTLSVPRARLRSPDDSARGGADGRLAL
jgi:PAS domain S-box-containing protein